MRGISKRGHDLISGELITGAWMFSTLSPAAQIYRCTHCNIDSCTLDAGFPKANAWVHCNTRIDFALERSHRDFLIPKLTRRNSDPNEF